MAKRTRAETSGDEGLSKRTRTTAPMAFPSSTAAPLSLPGPSQMLNVVPLNEVEDNSVERRIEALQRRQLPNNRILPSINGTAYDSPEHILIANRPIAHANLSFPEDLAPDELRKRQRLAHRVVMTQRENPPALPPTKVPELPEKTLIDTLPFYGAQRAAEITEINRERNNQAAMRGRKVKDEKLANGEQMLIRAFARTTWLETRLATLGVDADQEWAAVPDGFKLALHMEIWAGIKEIDDARDEERKGWVSKRRKQKGVTLDNLGLRRKKNGETVGSERATGVGTDGKEKRRGRRQTEEDKEYEQWQQPEEDESHLPSMPMSDTGLESELSQIGRSQSFNLTPLQAVDMTTTTDPYMLTGSTMDLVHGGSHHHHHHQYHGFDGDLHHHGLSSQGLDFGMGQQQQQTTCGDGSHRVLAKLTVLRCPSIQICTGLGDLDYEQKQLGRRRRIGGKLDVVQNC